MTKVVARTRRRPVGVRRQTLRESLLASVASAPLLPTYDLTRGSVAQRYWYDQALGAGIENWGHDHWPCDEATLDVTEAEFRGGGEVVFRTPTGALAYVELGGGWMHVAVASPDPAEIGSVFAAFRERYPASYLAHTEDPRVPITFWANSNFGPTARLRKVDSALWADITGNYSAEVEAKLGALMAWKNGPPSKDGGQLILWQGPPGTGKSWGLRALASEWAPWAEFHYITDPDSFFVDDPSYMIQVLLADSYEAIDEPTGDVYSEQRDGKWRVLILEDTGELLSATAKEKYGQGLSRLLNVVDGMIGQGLKVLALVTTNDELGDLHPAVTRPGRCAMQIEFGPLTDDEARAWTGDSDATAGTIAELYAKYGKADAAEALASGDDSEAEADPLLAGGMVRIPGTDYWTPAAALEHAVSLAEDAKANDLRAAIFQVASDHQDDAVGYGETAWLEESRTVLYVAGDWTDTDGIEADFLAIDGVDAFLSEDEGLPDGWWDAELVYPEDPAGWVTTPPEDEDAALGRVVALAATPLELTAAAVVAEPEPAAPTSESRMLDVLERFATRPEPVHQAPVFHVHLPATALGVTVERQTPDVTVPVTVEGAEIHVPAQEPPNITVTASAEPAPVIVNVPEGPAPVVHTHVEPTPVTVEAHTHVEQPRPRSVRVEVDDDGSKRYVPQED